MKILMLTLYLPYPPSSGGQIRSYNLIKHLAKTHEITLYSVIKKGEEKYAGEMRKYCKEVLYFYRSDKPWRLVNIIRTGSSLYPFLVMRNLSEDGKKALEKKLSREHFDLIHVETFYLRPHLPKTTIPIVLVDQTIEFQVYQHFVDTFRPFPLRPFLYVDVFKLKYWETKFWREASKVVAVSQADAAVVRRYVPGIKVGIVPNAPGEDLADLYLKRAKPDFANPVIYFQSGFLWLQNVEGAKILAREVFPLIKKKIPKARCQIVGQNAAKKIGYLANKSVQIIDLETSDIAGVRRAYLSGTVFVAPLWGPGGTRLKILSAMATGVPVVTTPVGAAGIEVENNRDILIRSRPEEMAAAVVELVQNPSLYRSIQKNARKLIEGKYNWKVIAQNLSQIYEETANRG